MPITRKIGNSSVNAISFGAMGMSAFYGDSGSDDAMVKVLKQAVAAGCYIDTADMYGTNMGDNEKLISNILKTPEEREKVFIASKFANLIKHDGPWEVHGEPEYVHSAIEETLKHLGISQLDLYYQHRVDRNTPIEETVKAMKELQDAGKIKYIGLSEANEDEIRRASKVAKIDALQVELSPWTPNVVTNGILAVTKELGITLVAYSPLGRGFLTGAITKPEDLADNDFRKHNPRFLQEAFEKNMKLVEEIKKIAARYSATPGQISLAWVVAQSDNIIAIPGTRREKYLEENLAAGDIVLKKEDLAELDQLIHGFDVEGGRYHDSLAGSVAF